jgi:hypothetical protein
MGPEILVPISIFGFITLMVLVPIYLRHKQKQEGYRLIHEAMARGQTLDPKMIEQIVQSKERQEGPRWRRSLGAGVVLCALALGLVGIAYADGYDAGPIKGAVIVGALGLGFIGLAIIDIFTRKPNGEA